MPSAAVLGYPKQWSPAPCLNLCLFFPLDMLFSPCLGADSGCQETAGCVKHTSTLYCLSLILPPLPALRILYWDLHLSPNWLEFQGPWQTAQEHLCRESSEALLRVHGEGSLHMERCFRWLSGRKEQLSFLVGPVCGRHGLRVILPVSGVLPGVQGRVPLSYC